MAELQRAVALAERRAIESVAGERLKMELLLESASKKSPPKTEESPLSKISRSTNDVVDNTDQVESIVFFADF